MGKALATIHAIPEAQAKQAGMPIEVDSHQSMKEHIIELLSTQGLTIAEFAMISGLKEYDEMAKQILGNEPE